MRKPKKDMIKKIPSENKCWKDNNTGHKFIHSSGIKGIPLYIENTDKAKENFINNFSEVDIKDI